RRQRRGDGGQLRGAHHRAQHAHLLRSGPGEGGPYQPPPGTGRGAAAGTAPARRRGDRGRATRSAARSGPGAASRNGRAANRVLTERDKTMGIEDFKNGTGQRLYARAKQILPGGAQLLGKRAEMYLPDLWPAYYSRASGCEVWDLD